MATSEWHKCSRILVRGLDLRGRERRLQVADVGDEAGVALRVQRVQPAQGAPRVQKYA